MSGTMEEKVAFLSERVLTLERRLATLQEMGTALGESLNLDDVLQTITNQVTNLLDADRATLYVVDEKERKLRSRVTVGGRVEEIVLELGEGIAGWAARTGRSVNLKDVYRDQRFNAHVDKLTGYRTRSMLCQPMRTPRGRIVGVAQVMNKRGAGYFTVEDEHLLTSMTTQAAIALENAKLFSDVLKTNIQLRDAQDRLQRNYERLELLYRIETEITSTMDPDKLLERILSLCVEAVTSEVGALMIRHETAGDLYHTEGGGEVRKLDNALVGGVMGEVFRTGQEQSVGGTLAASPMRPLHPELDVDLRVAYCVPILDNEGEPVGVLALANPKRRAADYGPDDRKLVAFLASQIGRAVNRFRRQQELIQARNLAVLGKTLSGIIHDFKTPMTVISGYVQMMQAEDDPVQREDYSQLILKQFKHLSSMTGEVLAFARGDAEMLKRPVFVDRMIDELREQLEHEFAGFNVTLEAVCRVTRKIKVDEGKIRRLVFNFARNAREAMPEGGLFRIEVTETGDDRVRFRFSDTGRGIPDEIRHRLFESFVTRGKRDGSGLGLAIVKKIVDDHEGSIDFHSEAGKGTTFDVFLPMNGD
jgi:signal transduction histidine kinase/putative methionine-R-sulfoxide reductase with GAF domain